jgi:hypothetical protein
MLTIGGLFFALCCVFGSYLASGGSMEVLLEALPFELLTIGGAAIGTFLMANSMHGVKHTLVGFKKILKGAAYRKSWPTPRGRWRWSRISRSRTKAPRSRNFRRCWLIIMQAK